MSRYLKLNEKNWRKLCKKKLRFEQQKMNLDDKKQIEFNLEKEKDK